ncbi:MAG: hypothetical protein K2I87_03305 [Bacteroidales bacterium]|nr:hypothetical protein [Bacteroidales bacterium]
MNLQRLVFVPLLLVCFVATTYSKTVTASDYIGSRYYTRITEAQLAYLQEDYAEAYRILLDLEAEVSLLNNLMTYEMPMLVELCLHYGDYEKAYAYIRSLVSDHGFSIGFFADYENFDRLKGKPFYDSSSLAKAEANFVTDSILVQKMYTLFQRDTAYRNSLNEWPLSDSEMAGLRRVDSCNFYDFKEILSEYGFPLAQNKQFTLQQRSMVFASLSAMCMHLVDSVYMAFLTPILYQNIRSGDCPPEFLGNMFDSKARADSCFPYGMYMNVGKEMICDVEHLDERRAEIGLPPHRLSCQKTLANLKKYAIDESTLSMFNCDF